MATWAEFQAGPAEMGEQARAEAAASWSALPSGAAPLAEAGRRLLFGEMPVALLATVTAGGRPRVHPFIPRIVDGRVWAFIVEYSPKRQDLERRQRYTIHSPLADEDEEFWFSGRARREDDPETRDRVAAAMPHTIHDWELLFEFDLELVGWTRWLDWGTPMHRPVHHRWRASG